MMRRNAFWKTLQAAGGFIVGATGVLGWLNITPEMVGETAYSIAYVVFPIASFLGGALSGWSLTKLWADRRIAELNGLKREYKALFDEFRSLTHGEQRQIVNIMLSEPGGIAPSEEQRKSMSDWVKMKDFVRHDPVTDKLHLVDSVKEMLLENPEHIYNLMAARVADLEDERSRTPGKASASASVDEKELEKLKIQNAAIKSNLLDKDKEIASLKRRVDESKGTNTEPSHHVDPSDEERYALIGTAGLADLLWAYDYIDRNGSIPASPLGGKLDSARIQRLMEKGVLRSIGSLLSGGASYDMVKEWSLFVHRERGEIERRLSDLRNG